MLFTIGYATKPTSVFIEQLQRHRIDVVADIRSVPYSKVFHNYHQPAIAKSLRANRIRYVYLGDELGPRSKVPEHYDDEGQVQFDRLMQAPLFAQGVARLHEGLSKGFRIALMCAEKDPATCHRSLLVGYFLEHGLERGAVAENTVVDRVRERIKVPVFHIDHHGEIEEQKALEQRLCCITKVTDDLFLSENEALEQAYQLQLKATSYRKPER